MRKWGADPAQSMSRMGTGARDTSDSKLIDDSTKLFPSTSSSTGGEMGFSGGISGIGAGEGEGNVFRNERNASISSTSSTGSDRLMGPASAVTEYPHPRRVSFFFLFLFWLSPWCSPTFLPTYLPTLIGGSWQGWLVMMSEVWLGEAEVEERTCGLTVRRKIVIPRPLRRLNRPEETQRPG